MNKYSLYLFSPQNNIYTMNELFGFSLFGGKKDKPVTKPIKPIDHRQRRLDQLDWETGIEQRNTNAALADMKSLHDEIIESQKQREKEKLDMIKKMGGNTSYIQNQNSDMSKSQEQQARYNISMAAIRGQVANQNLDKDHIMQQADLLRARLKNRYNEHYEVEITMSQYAPYLFQKPLIEETILDNYTDEELVDIYLEFMIETFGEYILNENYYNFIINKYGETEIINELFDWLKGNKSTTVQKSAPYIHQFRTVDQKREDIQQKAQTQAALAKRAEERKQEENRRYNSQNTNQEIIAPRTTLPIQSRTPISDNNPNSKLKIAMRTDPDFRDRVKQERIDRVKYILSHGGKL